jgi:outer membrane protein assembly factor BamB
MVAALAAGALYAITTDVMSRPGNTVLTALRANDGSSLWQKTFVGSGAVIAASQGAVYLALDGNGSVPNTIEMLHDQDGAVVWRIQVAGAGPLHASMSNGTIYVTSFTSMLPSPGYYYASTLIYALNASTGAVNWHSEIGRTNYVAAVANGAVYLIDTGTDVVCDPNVLHVLSTTDGRERWQASGTLLQLIGIEQGRAYITDVPERCSAFTYDHIALHALNTDDGSSVWQVALQSAYYGGPLADGLIFLPGDGDAVAAYNASNGYRRWYIHGVNGLLWVLDHGLYSSVAGQGIVALNPATGAARWRYQTSDPVFLSAAIQGMLYGVSSRQITNASWSQSIVALRTSDGKLLWRFPMGTFPTVGSRETSLIAG